MGGERHAHTVRGTQIGRLVVTKMDIVVMVVQGYYRHLTAILILYTTATLGKGMDLNDDENPFSWHRVGLNLPLGGNYTLSNTWVSKFRKDGNVAREVFIYVDDVRSLEWCDRVCWNFMR